MSYSNSVVELLLVKYVGLNIWC